MADVPQVELRPAAPDDVKLLFGWRNDPFVIARSSSRRMVEWTEHQAWFTAAITSGNLMIFVIERERDPIGQLRLERAADDCIMSVYLLEAYTGRGYGVRAILEGCARARHVWAVGRVIACVRDDNATGALGFAKAGFRTCPQPKRCPDQHQCFVFDQWASI